MSTTSTWWRTRLAPWPRSTDISGRRCTPTPPARIGRLVEAKPNGGYGAHGSRLEDYGLDAALERERYARYMAHFGIQPEARRRSPQSAKAPPLLASGRSAKPVE